MRHASGDQLQVFPAETIPLARGDNHHLGVLNTHQLNQNRTGRRDMGQGGDAVEHGSTEWLRCQRGAHIADDDIRPPRLQSYLPAFLKTSEIPTSATTAAIPMEIPISVNPVLTRRRIRPRATTVRKLMSAGETVDESAVLHRKVFEARPAIPMSWVTSMTVICCSVWIRTMRSRTSSALALSRYRWVHRQGAPNRSPGFERYGDALPSPPDNFAENG